MVGVFLEGNWFLDLEIIRIKGFEKIKIHWLLRKILRVEMKWKMLWNSQKYDLSELKIEI